MDFTKEAFAAQRGGKQGGQFQNGHGGVLATVQDVLNENLKAFELISHLRASAAKCLYPNSTYRQLLSKP